MHRGKRVQFSWVGDCLRFVTKVSEIEFFALWAARTRFRSDSESAINN